MHRAAAGTPDTEPALTRPILCEARRLRAAELLTQRHTVAEVAAAVGASHDSVRRWRAQLAKGGLEALRRRRASGRPPKLTAGQVAKVEQALQAGCQGQRVRHRAVDVAAGGQGRGAHDRSVVGTHHDLAAAAPAAGLERAAP